MGPINGMARATLVSMRYLLAAVLLFALPACAPDVDAFDVDPALRVPFEVAARVWSDRGGPCAYQAPDGPSTLNLVRSYGDGHDDRIGYAVRRPDGSTDATILDGLEPGLELAVVLHELGHHFGCPDSDDTSDVMRHYPDALTTIPTARDLACAIE